MTAMAPELVDIQRELGINGLDLSATMQYIREYWPFFSEEEQEHIREVFVVNESGASIIGLCFMKGGISVVMGEPASV